MPLAEEDCAVAVYEGAAEVLLELDVDDVGGGGVGGSTFNGKSRTGGGGGGGGGGAPPSKLQEPWMMPIDSSAKNVNRPREKSRPPYGHPGH